MWKSAVLLAAALCSLGLAPERASALTIGNIPVKGMSFIGITAGAVWMGTKPSAGGNCQWVYLGPTSGGGLSDDTRIVGTADDDYIVVVNGSTTTTCGPFTPLALTARSFEIRGMNGNDTIVGGRATYRIDGGPHNDFIICDVQGGTIAMGSLGNDTIYGGDGGNDLLSGNEGDDLVCKRPGTNPARLMDGGANRDFSCGSAVTRQNFEGTDCPRCGF